jgi:hypothetical protein
MKNPNKSKQAVETLSEPRWWPRLDKSRRDCFRTVVAGHRPIGRRPTENPTGESFQNADSPVGRLGSFPSIPNPSPVHFRRDYCGEME